MAKLGSNPSFVWRSIYARAEVLKKGIRWRVGDGKGLTIGEDPWLPSPSSFMPISPIPHEWKTRAVADLIEEDGKSWKKDLVEDLFFTQEANMIIGSPLSKYKAENRLIWHWTTNGVFTVKSAYYQALEVVSVRRSQGLKGGPSSNNGNHWNDIWCMNVPNKIKNFFWRACKGILPTAVSLKKGHCVDHTFCVLCGNPLESVIHALRDCRWAKEVWYEWGLRRGESWVIGEEI